MESVAPRVAARTPQSFALPDAEALSAWALAGAIVLYLAVDGGDYDIASSSARSPK